MKRTGKLCKRTGKFYKHWKLLMLEEHLTNLVIEKDGKVTSAMYLGEHLTKVELNILTKINTEEFKTLKRGKTI